MTTIYNYDEQDQFAIDVMDEDDNMSECDGCGDMFELGTFNIFEDDEGIQEAYCDECWKLKNKCD
jgi:hypothetical protein